MNLRAVKEREEITTTRHRNRAVKRQYKMSLLKLYCWSSVGLRVTVVVENKCKENFHTLSYFKIRKTEKINTKEE